MERIWLSIAHSDGRLLYFYQFSLPLYIFSLKKLGECTSIAEHTDLCYVDAGVVSPEIVGSRAFEALSRGAYLHAVSLAVHLQEKRPTARRARREIFVAIFYVI